MTTGNRTDIRPDGSNQHPWRLLGPATTLAAGTTALSAATAYLGPVPASYLAGSGAWVTSPAAGRYLIPAWDPSHNLMLRFFGSDADTETNTGRVWGIRPIDGESSAGRAVTEYTADMLLDLTALTLGGTSILAASETIRVAGGLGRWVDTITIGTDESLTAPGARLVGDPADGAATLIFDAMGYAAFLVELRCGTSASVGGLWSAV